jgi:hypothetical protein
MKYIGLIALLASQLIYLGCGSSLGPSDEKKSSEVTTVVSPKKGLPLLNQAQVGSDIVVYPDSQNSKKFYYFPKVIGFAKNDDGKPLMSLTQVKDGDKVLSYAVMVLEMKGSPAAEHWKKSNLDKSLEWLPVTVVGLKNVRPEYYSDLYLSEFAGVVETQMGLNAILTSQGAAAYKQAITTGNGDTGIVACYKFDGYDNHNKVISQKFCVPIDLSELPRYSKDLIIEDMGR